MIKSNTDIQYDRALDLLAYLSGSLIANSRSMVSTTILNVLACKQNRMAMARGTVLGKPSIPDKPRPKVNDKRKYL